MPSPEDDCPANLKQIIRELETVLPPLPRSGSVQPERSSEPLTSFAGYGYGQFEHQLRESSSRSGGR